jgi:uncharacterized membrane protein YesL
MKESKLHMVLTALIDIIWLGILWLVCSLPVITIGAASTALYYTMVKCVRHDIPEPTRFCFRAFRKNFRQATLLWLLCLAALGVGLLDIVAFSQMGVKRGDFLYIFSRLLLLPVPMLFPWIFAFLSRFENTVTGTLRFAVWLALKNWKQTLLMFFEAALVGLICWLLPQIAPLMPGVLCLLTSFSIEPALRELSAGQGRPDDWYNE